MFTIIFEFRGDVFRADAVKYIIGIDEDKTFRVGLNDNAGFTDYGPFRSIEAMIAQRDIAVNAWKRALSEMNLINIAQAAQGAAGRT